MYLTTIKEVEQAVGRKAADIVETKNEYILVFSGGLSTDERPRTGGDVRFHIRKW